MTSPSREHTGCPVSRSDQNRRRLDSEVGVRGRPERFTTRSEVTNGPEAQGTFEPPHPRLRDNGCRNPTSTMELGRVGTLPDVPSHLLDRDPPALERGR